MEITARTEAANMSFDAQFGNKQSIDFPQGQVDIVDIVPPNASETPILLVPGWSENLDTYKKTLKVIHDSGYRGLSLSYFGRGKAEGEEDSLPEVELRHAEEIISTLGMKGVTEADAIFHSEGAISGLIAATLRPDLFRNIVLDKPAGLIGEDSNAKLMGRFIKLLAKEAFERKPFSFTDPTNSLSSTARTCAYMVKHRELFTELTGITTSDITDFIHNLEAQGIKFSIVAGPIDPLFPTGRQIEHMRAAKEERGKRLPIEGYYSVKGGHNELSIHADQHTALAVDAIKGLQRRREKLEKQEEVVE